MAHWISRAVYRLAPPATRLRWEYELLSALVRVQQTGTSGTWGDVLIAHHLAFPKSRHAVSAATQLKQDGYMEQDTSESLATYAITKSGLARFAELRLIFDPRLAQA